MSTPIKKNCNLVSDNFIVFPFVELKRHLFLMQSALFISLSLL
jgi:hypothetical protein